MVCPRANSGREIDSVFNRLLRGVDAVDLGDGRGVLPQQFHRVVPQPVGVLDLDLVATRLGLGDANDGLATGAVYE